jgi:hypothetical protein
VDKNYLIKLWAAEKETLLFYANTDKANTVLGKSSLEEAMASAWKWEQKVRKAE